MLQDPNKHCSNCWFTFIIKVRLHGTGGTESEGTESDLKAPNISVGERVKINKYENIFRKR